MKRRFTEEQIIGLLREADAGLPLKELCRKHGFSEPSYYAWKAKFGGMKVSDAQRLKALRPKTASSSAFSRTPCWRLTRCARCCRENSGHDGTARGSARVQGSEPERTYGVEAGGHQRQRPALPTSRRRQQQAARAPEGARRPAPPPRLPNAARQADPSGLGHQRQTYLPAVPGRRPHGAPASTQEAVRPRAAAAAATEPAQRGVGLLP